jgi:hypothetical protein
MKILRSLFPILVIPLFGASVWAEQQQPHEQKPLVARSIDYLKPPETLDALWMEADAVLQVAVVGSSSRSHAPSTAPEHPRVFTLHTMEVQEVFKGDGHSGIAGGRVEVIQDAGEVELSDKRIQVNPGFQPFREGGEYILFLEWNDVLNAYDILYGPSATFVIFNDAVDTPAPRGPARQFRGMRLDTFTGLLRKLR